jgi:hypothetical protein
MVYWSGSPEQWNLIQDIQSMKRDSLGLSGVNAIRSDSYTMTNPVTGHNVPIEDLRYAKQHMNEIYNSSAIREDRWAFLWYH